MKYERLTETKKINEYCSTVECEEHCEDCYVGNLYNRLAELEDKIENGTLIELPCKVGDTVWDIVKSINRTENTIIYKHIQEYQVERIEIDSYNLLYLVISVFTEDGICEGYARPNQVYYTKAEAEAKLKELKGE